MNTKQILTIILFALAILGMFASQTFPRNSLPHYLMWTECFLAGATAIWLLFRTFKK